MANNTPNYNLYKKDPVTDKNDTFNIQTMLNDNWDKIDTELKNIEDNKSNKDLSNVPNADLLAKGVDAGLETTTGAQEKADTAERNAITAAAADATNKANAVVNLIPTSLPANGGNANYANTAGNANALGGVPASGFYSSGNKACVTGTYVGDNNYKKFINLGFTPNAVEVYFYTGYQYAPVDFFGGLALQNKPCKTPSGLNVIDIEGTGFNVYRDSGARISSHINGLEHYFIAYK